MLIVDTMTPVHDVVYVAVHHNELAAITLGKLITRLVHTHMHTHIKFCCCIGLIMTTRSLQRCYAMGCHEVVTTL